MNDGEDNNNCECSKHIKEEVKVKEEDMEEDKTLDEHIDNALKTGLLGPAGKLKN